MIPITILLTTPCQRQATNAPDDTSSATAAMTKWRMANFFVRVGDLGSFTQ